MTIKQLGGVFGRNPTFNDVTIEGTLTFDGALDINSDINLPDNKKITFGDNSDLSIYSDNSHSYIQEGAGTSGIRITTDNSVAIRKHDDENIAVFNVDGAVRLYHDNAERIATTSTGIDITGDITLGDNNPTITFNDSSITDLSHSISSASDNLRIMADVNGVDAGSRVEIFDGTTEVARFEAGAVDVTGTVTADGLVIDTPTSGAAATISMRDNTANSFVVKQGTNEYINIDTTNAAEVITLGNTTTIADVIIPAGQVGIGTTSPSTPLHVNSGTGNIAATFESTDAGSYINIIDNGSGAFGAMIGAVSDDIVFSPNNVEAMRIDSSGHVIAPYGVTLGTAAGTYNAANTLDDYEEGTFTPTVAGDATGVFGAAEGYYTKVGRLVFIEVYFTVGTNFTSNTVGGLPFTVANLATGTSYGQSAVVLTSAADTVTGAVQEATTNASFYNDHNILSTHAPNTTNSAYRLSMCYQST